MNVLGCSVSVAESLDPTTVGLDGTVVLETAKTLVVSAGGGNVIIQKKGTVLRLSDSSTVKCEDMMGRLEDRLRSKA